MKIESLLKWLKIKMMKVQLFLIMSSKLTMVCRVNYKLYMLASTALSNTRQFKAEPTDSDIESAIQLDGLVTVTLLTS